MDKILIPQPVAAVGVDFLQERGYEIIYADGEKKEALKEAIRECSAVWLGVPSIGREEMEAAPNLKIIARQGAGFNNVDIKAAEERGIWVTNAPDATTETAAEFTLGGILALAKKMFLCCERLKKGDFDFKNSNRGEDLKGKTLSIIGYGRIGRKVAEKAYYGFGMKILAYGPHLIPEETEDYVTAVSWDRAFQEGDFVTLHMPLTEDTTKCVGKREFQMMKTSAKLINCARGAVVEEEELVAALEQGEISGLFTDVFMEEPPALSHPFFHMDHVIASPHMATSTEECRIRMALHAVEQIHKVLSGEKPDTPVNMVRR